MCGGEGYTHTHPLFVLFLWRTLTNATTKSFFLHKGILQSLNSIKSSRNAAVEGQNLRDQGLCSGATRSLNPGCPLKNVSLWSPFITIS